RARRAGSAREEAEQGGGEAADGDEEEKRDPRVPGELVEGKRVADDGTGQRDVRPEQVEPARRGDDDPEAGERGECEPDPTHARGGSLRRGAPGWPRRARAPSRGRRGRGRSGGRCPDGRARLRRRGSALGADPSSPSRTTRTCAPGGARTRPRRRSRVGCSG